MAKELQEQVWWTNRIRPKESLLQVNLREIWQYRDLILLFVHRHLVIQYKQTILGPLWFIIQPLMTTVMYMLVFGHIAGIPTDGVPQPLFYLSGMCLWQYFSDCFGTTQNIFVTNAGIFSKIYFPRMVVPISAVIAYLLKLAIQFALFVAVYVIYVLEGLSPQVNLYVLTVPLLILMVAGLSLGFGMIFSALTTKYRDLQILLTFLIPLWMYVTPIVYPLTQVRGRSFGGIDLYTLMCLNPLTPLIETFKHGLLGGGEFIGWGWLAYSLVSVVAILFAGIIIFNRIEKTFMDTV